MPIDCTKCQICGVYRKKVIWEFAGGKSKFAHAFFETLKKFFLEAPWRKSPTCGTQTFFLSLLIRLRLSMAVFRISISVIVFVLLKVRINAPKKYRRIEGIDPPLSSFFFILVLESWNFAYVCKTWKKKPCSRKIFDFFDRKCEKKNKNTKKTRVLGVFSNYYSSASMTPRNTTQVSFESWVLIRLPKGVHLSDM